MKRLEDMFSKRKVDSRLLESLGECSHSTNNAACWLDDIAWGMFLHYRSRAMVWLDGDLRDGSYLAASKLDAVRAVNDAKLAST